MIAAANSRGLSNGNARAGMLRIQTAKLKDAC
jgi:hypothetical protein